MNRAHATRTKPIRKYYFCGLLSVAVLLLTLARGTFEQNNKYNTFYSIRNVETKIECSVYINVQCVHIIIIIIFFFIHN